MTQQAWKKSSFSSTNGTCVDTLRYVKSSFSATNCTCVEMATCPDEDHMHVRDSKDPDGPVLTFDHADWHAFLDTIKLGDYSAS